MQRRNNKAYKRYKTPRWKTLRLQFLRANPLCANHYSHGGGGDCREFATEVDHIVRCESNKDVKFYELGNLQGLCKSCHSRKTAREDGAFGNRKKGKINE